MDNDKQAPPAHAAAAADLYARCATLARQLIEPLLTSLFESIDDTLFDRAEKAANNALQTHYFEGMREVRRKRRAAERAFREQLKLNFDSFRKGTPPAARVAGEAQPQDGADMSLVEDRELEEELAISEMIAKGDKHLSRALYGLNQRLAAVLRVPPRGDDENPLGPASLCHCFRLAALNFDVETPVLLVIYKLFEKRVIEGLAPVYARVNDELIGHRILPQLRVAAGAPTTTVTAAPAATVATADPSAPGPPTAASDGEQHLSSQLLANILELLTGRRRATVTRVDDPPPVATGDLLNALHVLQNERAVAPPPGGGRTIKGVVLDQAAKLIDRTSASAGAGDEDSIDLVAMLFEFILQDRNLPDAMQVMLSRLQIPFIKAALLDRRLFASKSHPARRLLDALAEASVGWSRESDRGQRLYKKVSEVVEAVLRDFDDDVTTFERLVADFEDFLIKTKRRAEVAEKRTTEATQGRERLQRARQQAAEEISARLKSADLPKLIKEILRKPWANVLVLTHLRHGEDSEEFGQAVKFVDSLIWTAQPKTTAGDVARLQSTLPHLSRQLRTGLGMVAYQDEDVAKVFKSLKQLYRSMIDRQYREHLTMPGLASKPKPAAPVPEPVTPIVLPVAAGGDILDTAPEQTPAQAPAQIDAARLQWVKDLEVGTWFEFWDEAGNKVRAKLSWKSPITSKFLLVDQKGLKVADKPLAELAQEIISGDTVVLEAVPLFQRALGAIADRLRDEKAQRGGPGEDGGRSGDRQSPGEGAG